MTQHRHRRRAIAATAAMLSALARYQTTIVPVADAEIARWRARAEHIGDSRLRDLALTTIDQEDANAAAAAVFALLAPRQTRRATTELLTAWQLMYDLLDTLTEVPGPDPLAASLRAHRALAVSIDPTFTLDEVPAAEDGGYLLELAATCRQRLWRLPAAAAVAPVAATEAERCALAQSHTHAAMLTGDETALHAWAADAATSDEDQWWETAAGGISSLGILALLAIGADPATTESEAASVADAYRAVCALSTLLDSLVDIVADERTGNASYFGRYVDHDAAASGLQRMTRLSVTAVARLPNAATHEAIVAGVAAFYLAKLPPTARLDQRAAAERTRAELGPSVVPALCLLALRKRRKPRRDRAFS